MTTNPITDPTIRSAATFTGRNTVKADLIASLDTANKELAEIMGRLEQWAKYSTPEAAKSHKIDTFRRMVSESQVATLEALIGSLG